MTPFTTLPTSDPQYQITINTRSPLTIATTPQPSAEIVSPPVLAWKQQYCPSVLLSEISDQRAIAHDHDNDSFMEKIGDQWIIVNLWYLVYDFYGKNLSI